MANKITVLVVEDDVGISNFIRAILMANDYSVLTADMGKSAISMVSSRCPDLILLDMGLPDMDGLDVLNSIRLWSSIPVIVVSARGHEREKVEALDSGADDYLTKPFGTAELLVRIRTALRHRPSTSPNFYPVSSLFHIGSLLINYEKRIVEMDGNDIHLTPIEYKIIVLLSQNAGKVLTHDYIIRKVWGPFENDNQALRVNMANIRRKIEENPASPQYILTEVGVGYRMVDEI
jgi:two-component system KDP operon response regulator KdpE